MLTVFDYIFYRVTSYYLIHWKCEKYPWQNGIGVVCILQMATCWDIVVITSLLYGSTPHLLSHKSLALALAVSVLAFNYYRYTKKMNFEVLKDRWAHEVDTARETRGRLIILYLLVSVSIPIVYGVLRHNLHWI